MVSYLFVAFLIFGIGELFFDRSRRSALPGSEKRYKAATARIIFAYGLFVIFSFYILQALVEANYVSLIVFSACFACGVVAELTIAREKDNNWFYKVTKTTAKS